MIALITGASTGIGFELAKVFAENNYDLIIVGKDKKRLDDAGKQLLKYKVKIRKIAIDLAEKNSATRLYRMLDTKVDILVNNAGFGGYGEFKDTDLEKELEMMQLNMVTLTELTKHVVRDMIKNKKGKILNVASVAAFFPGPFMAIYYATKTYVLSFSVAIANELKGTGVTLSVLCPGPTKSNFQKTAELKMSEARLDMMDAKTVAEAGYKGLMKNRLIIIPGTKNKLQTLASNFFPRSVLANLVRIYQDEKL